MIERIKSLQNFGPFTVAHGIGGKLLEKHTIFYGKNKQGKSTLIHLFRSIKEGGEPKYISCKKTLGGTGGIFIEIVIGGITKIFRSNIWEGGISISSKLFIFDSIFVHENIFQGENITSGNQANLNGLILGTAGLVLQKEIENLTTEIRNISTQKSRLTTEIRTSFDRSYTIELLLKISKTTTDYTVAKKGIQDEIVRFQNVEKIKNDISNFGKSITIDTVLVEKLRLKTNLDIATINDHIKENIHSHHQKDANSFLEKGLNLLLETSPRNCVFCGQDLASREDFIKTLNEFFRGNYKTIQVGVVEVKNFFYNQISISHIQNSLINLNEKYGFIIFDAKELGLFEINYVNFMEEIEKKLTDLDYDFDFTVFNDFNSKLELIRIKLRELYKQYNTDSKAKIIELNSELLKLQYEEKGFSADWEDKIKEYKNLEDETIKKTAERDLKMTTLKTYCDTIEIKYTTRINTWLGKLQADFRFGKLAPQQGIQQRSDVFGLELNGIEVPISDFSHTLSESDKRILAFAFFLCLLEEENLSNAVILFDDPINSLDDERKRKTVEIIGDLEAEQIIILTHDKEFLRELGNDPGFNGHAFIEIKKGVNGSATFHNDRSIKEVTEDEVRKLTKLVFEWYETGIIPDDYEKNCRRLTELLFEIKHHDIVKGQPFGSIRTYTKLVFTGNIEERKIFKEFDRLCTYLHVPLHDGTIPETSDGDKLTTIQKVIECIKMI